MITIEFEYEPCIQFENPPVDLYCMKVERYVFSHYTNKYYFCGEARDFVFDVKKAEWNLATKEDLDMLMVYILGFETYKPGDKMFEFVDRIIIE
jgi:hypothetical protein